VTSVRRWIRGRARTARNKRRRGFTQHFRLSTFLVALILLRAGRSGQTLATVETVLKLDPQIKSGLLGTMSFRGIAEAVAVYRIC